jgi:hypothetical protein
LECELDGAGDRGGTSYEPFEVVDGEKIEEHTLDADNAELRQDNDQKKTSILITIPLKTLIITSKVS